ncbi:hypothetical protein IB278_17075 [Variovorax sp. VRV01]|uniref:CC0125/CC1285 family lipoprotein n=1 Tax=Variovorax sp. VRV01 TaxID=2769259 RepID=UPI00177DCBAB|nr:hypothetical protein [Variovorax sp. VRV01]MBD9665683.1 hypothetical protein [Variovorax sp. VRV01]
MSIKTIATLIAATALTACVGPTPYRAAGAEGNNFGYSSSKLSDQLYRVRFVGSKATPQRWVEAFMLYRSAQVAKEAGAPAFKIVEGNVDTTVLTGDDVFGQGRPLADVGVSQMGQEPQIDGDRIVSARVPFMQRTAGAMPVFRAPPAPRISQPPLFIYTPVPSSPIVRGATILIELRPDFQSMDERTFVADDVIARIGPRVKLAQPSPDRPRPATTI